MYQLACTSLSRLKIITEKIYIIIFRFVCFWRANFKLDWFCEIIWTYHTHIAVLQYSFLLVFLIGVEVVACIALGIWQRQVCNKKENNDNDVLLSLCSFIYF